MQGQMCCAGSSKSMDFAFSSAPVCSSFTAVGTSAGDCFLRLRRQQTRKLKLRIVSGGCAGLRKTVAGSIWAAQSEVAAGKLIYVAGNIGSRYRRSVAERQRVRYGQRMHSTKSSSPGQTSEESQAGFRLAEGVEDFITKTLREYPSQVEPRYLIGDKFYTLREKLQLEAPMWEKVVAAAASLAKGIHRQQSTKSYLVEENLPSDSKFDQPDVAGPQKSSSKPTTGVNEHPARPVYLSDLLRQYKGNLYVPEEAFLSRGSAVKEFDRTLTVLPQMTFEGFLKYMLADQIELLTSRGRVSSQGGFQYWDFVVELKETPGEKTLQRRKWAMHLEDDEAEVVLKEYRGSQCEVESFLKPVVSLPPRVPHPVASSISARMVMELSVVVSIISAVAYVIWGFLAGVFFSVGSLLRAAVLKILLPSASPLVKLAMVLLRTTGSLGSTAVGMFTGVGGFGGFVSECYRLWKSGVLVSSARTLGAILFVLVSMAALAKFTLTRRPKDFTKWDLWQAIEFGHSKPQARVEGSTGVGFADVAGIEDVVKELQELVSYLKDPERFNQMGTKPPHGVLLEGPPGCGKTLLAKAIAGEAGVPFYQMAGSEFVEVLVGVGAARIRDLFKRAKVNRPSVVFIDEIDALGAIRHGAAGEEGMESYNAGAQERETTLNQLLIELDGFDTGKGVVFLGATNRMDMLDPALLRPGRFDRKIAIRPPRAKGRLEILKVHSKGLKLDESVDLWLYAKNLPGWSGAELAQLLQESALMAVRHGGTRIKRVDVDQALDRLTTGAERMGAERRQPVHRRMATHEVGMAMASHILRRLENAQIEFCDRVSIVPRGETYSRIIFDKLDDEAYLFERRPTLIHRMQVMLGGRAAEEVMYGRDTSTLSLKNLPDASWLARKMISIWNIEGPLTIHGDMNPWERKSGFTGPPLSFEGGLYDNYELFEKSLNYDFDDETAERTKALLDTKYAETLTLLKQHHAALTKAIYVVMEKEELFGEDLELILDLYPAGMAAQLVEEEEEPGELPFNYRESQGPAWKTNKLFSGDRIVGMASSRQDMESIDEYLVRTIDSNGIVNFDESGFLEGTSGTEEETSSQSSRKKPRGNGEARLKDILKGTDVRDKNLGEGDIAATNRGGFVDCDAPTAVRTGKIDSHN